MKLTCNYLVIIVVPLVVFDAASEFPTNSGSSGIDWGAVIFMAIFGLLFTAGAISLIVSALRRPRKVVFCVDPGAVLMEYGCKAPEVRFDESQYNLMLLLLVEEKRIIINYLKLFRVHPFVIQ